MFLSKHLPDAVTRPRHKGAGGGRRGGGRGGGDDGRPPPVSAVLGDLEWDNMRDQEATVLMWDGYDVGGVELDEPTHENRPIRLTVSYRTVACSVLTRYPLFSVPSPRDYQPSPGFQLIHLFFLCI